MSIKPTIATRDLTEFARNQLDDLIVSMGEPPSDLATLRLDTQQGVRSLEEMTNVPKSLRRRLEQDGYTVGRVTMINCR